MKYLPIIFCALCVTGCVATPATDETRDSYSAMRALDEEIVALQDARIEAERGSDTERAQDLAQKIESRERAFERLQRRVEALAPARRQEQEQSQKTRGMIMGGLAMVGPYIMRLLGAAARAAT